MNYRTHRSTIILSLLLVAVLMGLTVSARTPQTSRPSAGRSPGPGPTLATVADPGPPDFGFNCNPTSLTLVVGTLGSSTCTLTSLNGFSGNVSISAFDDFQTLLVNGSLHPPAKSVALASGGTASVTVNVAAGTSPFVYPIVVIAGSRVFVLETVVNPVGGPNFPDYSLTPSASSMTITPGTSATPSITLTAANGWAGKVNLAILFAFQTGGLGLSFTGGTDLAGVGTFLVVPSFTTTATSTLSITTSVATPPGVYMIIIQLTGGSSQPFAQHTLVLFVLVPAAPTNPSTSLVLSGGGAVPAPPASIPVGSMVLDTAKVGGQAPGIPATGTVTYSFFTNGGCAGTASSTQTVNLAGGAVPNSATTNALAAGNYSYSASFTSGDTNYANSVSPCESFIVK